MKTSWIIGVVMLWLLILSCEMFASGRPLGVITAEGQNVLTDNGTVSVLQGAASPIQESGSIFTGAWAIMTHVADYLRAFISILLLWSPTVFVGYYLWVWWFICFPVDCAMIFGIVSLVRGVHSA